MGLKDTFEGKKMQVTKKKKNLASSFMLLFDIYQTIQLNENVFPLLTEQQ